MLKLKPETPETITEEIEVTVPGYKKPGKFTATFKFRDKKDYLAFAESAKKGMSDIDLIMDTMTDWQGINGADNKPIEFSRENVATFLENYPNAAIEISEAYGLALFRSRVKN